MNYVHSNPIQTDIGRKKPTPSEEQGLKVYIYMYI